MIKRFNINVLFLIFLLSIATLYILFQSRAFRAGPFLSVKSPINGETLTDSFVNVSGTALRISYLSLNRNKIYVDENGSFNENIILSPGYNIIFVEAEDLFERKAEKRITVFLKEEMI